MCGSETRKEYLWPVINGCEWLVEYEAMLIDSEKDSYWEPGYETWALNTGSEIIHPNDEVSIWLPDDMLEDLCQKHFDSRY